MKSSLKLNIFVKKNYKLLILFILFITLVVTIFLLSDRLFKKEYISNAQVSKMISFACAENPEDFNYDNQWYKPYIEYVQVQGIFEVDNPTDSLKYKDLYNICSSFLNETEMEEYITGFNNNWKDSKREVAYNDFLDAYSELLPYMPCGDLVEEKDLGIAGTPANLDNTDEWQAYTSSGPMGFRGLNLNQYVDMTVKCYVRGDEILSIVDLVGNEAVYKNVFITRNDNNILTINLYGGIRQFEIENVPEDVVNNLVDLRVKKGNITNISVKADSIDGKVLSVTQDYVEIHGYGKVPLDADFAIYDLLNDARYKNYYDIIVGYDLQNFIVAEGKICGAIIRNELKISDIRVLIMESNYKGKLHSEVELSSRSDYKICYADGQDILSAGEIFTVDMQDERLKEGRITITPAPGATIILNSVERSLGTPEYEGTIELALYDEGIAIVNELSVEDYLKKVVPSEMPVSFGVEALKCQAVCARTYAYTKLMNTEYQKFGAHLDDSVSYQVYNNQAESPYANQAILDTKGEVITYDGNVIATYYYSTSWGYTSDGGLWGGKPEDKPYLETVALNPESCVDCDLSNEENFAARIKQENENDYDYEFSYYRWNMKVTLDSLSDNINNKLNKLYPSYGSKITVKKSDGTFVKEKISSIGKLVNLTVCERTSGGAASLLEIKGTEETIRISGEYLIRQILGNQEEAINHKNGVSNWNTLPSAYFIIETEKTDNTDYIIFRGGGYGHGVGMSQNAVKNMVKSMSYRDILYEFYPGTVITKLSE
ncbi:MAG: SpoIID/LytB domain-containing protein [Lachnospira sp.]